MQTLLEKEKKKKKKKKTAEISVLASDKVAQRCLIWVEVGEG